MTSRSFALVAGIFFLVMAVGHALRLAFGVSAVVAGWRVPAWVSVVAIVVLAYLAYSGLRLGRSRS
jgi:threonine/homoserine/homoserine lactone efflux protein